MNKITAMTLIVISFLVGSLSSTSFVNATTGAASPFDLIYLTISKLQNQENTLQNQVNTLQTQLGKLNSTVNSLLPSPIPIQTHIIITRGASSGQSCVTANNCFDPKKSSTNTGKTITWINNDTASHTVTSGKPSDSQTGTIFDSGLVKAGGTFAFKFTNAGTYSYYCQVHPWMTGMVTVK